MKVIYTIGWQFNTNPDKKYHGTLPFKFSKWNTAARLAHIIERIFRIHLWVITNNTYTDAEIAEIKAAYQKAQQTPLDQGDLKVWHWKD